MNANQIETWAAKCAANITDPYDRAAIAEKVREAAALIGGIGAGLTAGAPDGYLIVTCVAAELGTTRLGLRLLADRLQLGATYEPDIPVGDDDLVDVTRPLYAYTAGQLAAVRAASYRAGIEAREPVSV